MSVVRVPIASSQPTSIHTSNHVHAIYLSIQSEHGLDGHIGRTELVSLKHLLDQLLSVLYGVLRRLRQHDLVLLWSDLW